MATANRRLAATHPDQLARLRTYAQSILAQVQTLEDLTPHHTWPAETITTLLNDTATALDVADDVLAIDVDLHEPHIP